jgi:hypothetical protein
MSLPTHHPESTNGWNGANNDGIKDKPCDICGKVDVEKVYYHGGDGYQYGKDYNHIVACWPCSQTLDSSWYGCGCGG